MCAKRMSVLGLRVYRRDLGRRTNRPGAWLLLAVAGGCCITTAAVHAASPFKKQAPPAAQSGTATPAGYDEPADAPAGASTNGGKAAAGKGTGKAAGGAPTPAEIKKVDMIAVVNGEKVTREELAKECTKRFGTEVLDNMVHKQMIADYCRSRNVAVTTEEVEEEIDRMAKKFKIPKAQWIKLLEKERGITRSQYMEDIIWPSLALRKLAAPELTVSPEEIDKAYESQFGPAAKVRLIVLTSPEKAKKIHAQLTAKPDDFAALARQNSEDSASASAGGIIPPIRHHVGDPQLEKMAFELPEGAISPVVAVQKQFVIMKVEARLPGTKMDRALVDPVLVDALKEGKLHAASLDVFKRIETEAKADVIFGKPEKQKKMPGVAAIVGDHQITIRELAECCINRHGLEVLDRVLDRKLLNQALHRQKMAVDQTDIDAELARAAMSMGQIKADGRPDVDAWLDQVSKQQHVEIEVYLMDAVWPSVALKKLVGDNVPITDDDFKRGFEANYGPRCRCRAIILSNQRKAQEVWEKARDNSTLENFANLARQYSSESSSGSLGGQIPPIQRYGGQPLLENEAFSLKPNELSSVIQVGENFVILFCEGYSKPIDIDKVEARKYIEEDLREKKMRIAMHKEFDKLEEQATIDNYLAGTMKSPQSKKNMLKAKDPTEIDPSLGALPDAKPQGGKSVRR
jgi:parvulin-like peptidyl-prolyl isomerase